MSNNNNLHNTNFHKFCRAMIDFFWELRRVNKDPMHHKL